MNVHYYKQFFPGSDAVGTQQPRALTRLLSDRGHKVWVISTDFNIYDERDETEESHASRSGGEYHVLRLASPRNVRTNLRARLDSYLVFAARALARGLSLPAPDVVLGSIQPLFTGLSALAVAQRHRVPFVLEVRDLWPDALEAKGALAPWQGSPLHWMANLLYRRAARIVSLTPGIKRELVRKGISASNIDVLPNGFDPTLFETAPDARAVTRERYGWPDKFLALYAGAHTEVTAIDVIVRAAAEVRNPNVRFALFGAGQTKPAAMRLARALRLENIEFHDPVPKRQVPQLLAASDVCLMTLFQSPLVHIYFENKLLDYMGAGRPILAAMDGMQAELIASHETGSVVKTFDHVGLARLVSEAAKDYAPFAKMGENGRRLVRERFLLPNILDHYASLLEAAAAGRLGDHPVWEMSR